MLPTETFADAVAFLRLYDLGALAVTSALCFSLASKASTKIRWEDFRGFHFDVAAAWIQIIRDAEVGSAVSPGVEVASFYLKFVAHLDFGSANETAEFIVAAFPNCVIEDLAFLGPPSCWAGLIDVVRQVADSIVVSGALLQPQGMTPDDTFSLVRKFRKVKIEMAKDLTNFCLVCVDELLMRPLLQTYALQLDRAVSDDKAKEMADFYRGSGIQELQYFRDLADSAPHILTLF